MMRTIETCRSCNMSDLVEVLSLGELCLSAFVDEGAEVQRAPLELVLCKSCSLVQLRHTVSAEDMYRNYWYRSGTNRSMTAELEGIARAARSYLGLGDVALDIGCNDGTLLRAYGAGVFTVGFEPATNLIAAASDGTDLVINDFFNADAWRRAMLGRAKVVTSIAMFYDLDDPNAFVHDVHEVLDDDGVWILQMADLKSMLDRTMWDNICHEHLEYYSLTSLSSLLEWHGFRVVDVERNSVNGGSIRAIIRKRGRNAQTRSIRVRELLDEERVMGLDTFRPYEAFADRVRDETLSLVDFVKSKVAEGKKIYVYGASTKGNTLLQYAGLDSSLITAAAERNPDKWGKRTAGTNIPIVSEKEARDAKPDYMLVLPWHFLDEFVEREAEYLSGGGAFIVPLPTFRVVRG
jgi:NDP-4-keto-2,6-dideoxyhexose 3-C-methyltransferase